MYFKNFGVEQHDENAIIDRIRSKASKVRVLRSYNAGETYTIYEYGRIRLSCLSTGSGDQNEIVDTQMQGITGSVWTVRLSRPGTFFNDGDTRSTRMILAEHGDSEYGEVPIHVINPDILPSYTAPQIMTLQVTALPEYIEYYATREEFLKDIETVDLSKAPADALPDEDDLPDVDDIPEDEILNEDDLIPEPGYLASWYTGGIIPQCIEEHWELSGNDVVVLNATVKDVYEEHLPDGNAYNVVTVDTELGELEIIHSTAQVPAEQRAHIVPGAIVHCACHLVADPAIGEYENGAIYDSEHFPFLLR